MSDSIGRLIVSLAIIVGFFGFSYVVIKTPIQSEMRDVVLQVTGGLIGLLTVVVGYYVGSSAGSKSKEKALADSVPVKNLPNVAPDARRDTENG